jgi:conjugal transfer pilus assembly protein TrbC
MCKKIRLLVAALALAATPTWASSTPEFTPDPAMMEKARQAIAGKGALDADGQSRLDDLMTRFRSDEFKQQQQQYQQALKQQLNLDQWGLGESEGEEREMPFSDKPVLFVSSSVPLPTLRAFAHDLEKVGGVMVMRGGVGGLKRVRPTMEFIAKVLNVDADCEGASCKKRNVAFLIDPILFDAYNIRQVPALTYQDKTELLSYCDGLEMLPRTNAVIYGDATVGFMLKRIRTLTGNEGLTPLIKLLGA